MIIYSEARLVGDSINGELIDYCMEQCGNSRERVLDPLVDAADYDIWQNLDIDTEAKLIAPSLSIILTIPES